MLKQYNVSNYEYGTIVEQIKGSMLSSAKIGIKKIMPMMTIDNKKRKEYIDRNIFVNANDCRINTSSTIELQNYITVSKYDNDDPIPMGNKTIEINKKLYIPIDTSVMVEVLYEDILNMHLIRKG